MINLTAVIDNDEALKKLNELQDVAKKTTSSVVDDSEKMDYAFSRFGETLSGLVAGFAMEEFVRKMVDVRGEVQQLEIAFETMLGSKAKSDALMNEMMDLAAKTPFGLQDVTNAAKQLLAFGSTAEQISGEIVMLGDIAAGLSIPLNDMIYLYGTTRTQGRMFTADLQQFMGRGIPLAEELAKQFNVTSAEVKELVSQGKVGFAEVEKALQGMTGEGGKFGGLMEKQSVSIAGQISALEDSVYQIFNEIGKSNEGVISGILTGAGFVLEHYKTILSILKILIATYGAYKAAIIFTAAAQKALALAKTAKAFFELARGIKTAKDAMLLLNTATKANPWGLLASAVAFVGTTIWTLCDNSNKAKNAVGELNKEIGELEQKEHDNYTEANKLAYAYEHLADSEQERAEILKKLKDISPDIVKGIDNEADAIARLTENMGEYNASQLKRVQLASLTDKQTNLISQKGSAEAEMIALEAEMEARIAQLAADIKTGKLTAKNIKLEKTAESEYRVIPSDAKQIVFDKIVAILDSFTPEMSARDKANLLSDASYDKFKQSKKKGMYAVPQFTFGDYNTMGGVYNFDELIRQYDKQAKLGKSADEGLKSLLRDMPTILKELDLEDYGNEDAAADSLVTYAQAFANAKDAWINSRNALAAAMKDSTTTEADYMRLKEEAEAAEKRFKELGGITKAASTADEVNKEKKYQEEALKLRLKLEEEANQAIIDMMDEGAAKKRAQIKLNYDKELEEIKREEAALVLAQQAGLTDQQKAQFQAKREAAQKKFDTGVAETFTAELEAHDEYLIKYGDYEERKLAIKRKYERMLAEVPEGDTWRRQLLFKERDAELAEDERAMEDYLAKNGTFHERLLNTTKQYERKIAGAKNEAERLALEAERDVILAQFEVEASDWAKELVNKTTTQLNSMVAELEAQMEAEKTALDALESSDSGEAKDYQASINKLKAQIAALKAELGKAGRAASDNNWEEATQVFQSIASTAQEAAESISEFDEKLGFALNSIAQIASISIDMMGALKGVKEAFEKTGEAASAMEKASAILAVVAVAIKVVSGIFDIMKSNEEATRNAALAAYDYATALEKISNANLRKSFSTMFGKDDFGEFSALLEKMSQQLRELDDMAKDMASTSNSVIGGLGDKTSVWGSFGGLRKKMEEAQGYDAALVADMRSGWQKFWGSGNDNIKLTEFSEFYEDGKLNIDKLKAYYDTYKDYLTDEQADLIKAMIDAGEIYEENMSAINDYMSSIFGELGASITDSLVDAFKNGTDAAEAMGDAVAGVIEQMTTDMAHAAFIQPLLNEAQKGIEALNAERANGMSDEEYMRRLMEISSTLMGDATAQGEAMTAYLENMRKIAQEMGIDAFEGDMAAQTATARGFQAMSQDTGDELNGRFTDIQGKTTAINEAVQYIKGLSLSQLQCTTSISETLAQIHNDTSLIEKHTRELSSIRDGIDRMNRNIENI